jgi:hypothetical protein
MQHNDQSLSSVETAQQSSLAQEPTTSDESNQRQSRRRPKQGLEKVGTSTGSLGL